MTFRQIIGCLYLLAICTVLWPIELVWYRINRKRIMKLTILLTLMAAVAITFNASAAETKPPFRYNTNVLRQINLPDGSWALVDRKAKGDPMLAAPKEADVSEGWVSHLSLAPVGAIRTVDLNGHSEWGFGLDVGVAVNPFVSLHVVNLAFEGPGHSRSSNQDEGGTGHNSVRTTGPHSWGGTAIDETDLLVKAVISPWSTEKLSVYALAGGVHTWGNNHRWGLSAGGGVSLNFNKAFSLAGDYSVRMYDKPVDGSSLDGLVRALVSISF